jgi:iron complex outermembrane receptor protein
MNGSCTFEWSGHRIRIPLLALAALALVNASPAPAQQAGSAMTGLEEVIVTAQKRSENVQNVPIAMQAYTGDQLEQSGVKQLTDVVQMAPNLNVVQQNSLSQHIVIRGVGTNEFFGNAPSSVGMYMDEVTMNSSYMSTLGLFDMERVEVLRGPQNSLFGRNTTGGAINYITNQPKLGGAAEGYALLTYGRDNLAEVEAGGNLPMGSNMALRLAGIYHRRDGIWNNLDTGDNHYGDQDRYSLRGTFLWEIADGTRLTVSAHHARDRGEAQPQKMAGALCPVGTAQHALDGPCVADANNTALRVNDIAGFSSDIDWKNPSLIAGLVNIEGFDRATKRWNDVWVGGGQRADLDVDGGYVKLQHDLPGSQLSFIASTDRTHAWYEEDNTGNGNLTGGVNHDVLVIDMDQAYRQYTGELRLASTDESAKLRWITGLYYLQEDAELAQNIRFGSNGFPGANLAANNIVDPALMDLPVFPFTNPYPNTDSFSIAQLKDKSYSAYAQGDYKFTDAWSMTLGLRLTRDEKSNPYYFAGAFDKTGIDPSTYYDRDFIYAHAAGLPACVPSPHGPPFFVQCVGVNTSQAGVRAPLKNDQVGGKLGVQYQVSSDVMLYGSYSRGFKSGKFDMEFLHTDDTPFPQRPLKPEILNVFELGFKSKMSNSLLLNGAVFYNIWKDQQVFNVAPSGPQFFNLPESRIYGAELESQWVPATNWRVDASLGLLHTELTDVTGIDYDVFLPGQFFPQRQGDFQKGHELPLSPKVTANGGVERRLPLGNNALTLRLDGRYQSSSKVKYSPQHPIDTYDSRFEVNARAAYSFGNGGLKEISLYANNLFNEKYCLEIQDLRGVSGSYYCVPNEGRTAFGLQAKFGF